MKQNEANRLAGNLVTKFGLPVKASVGTGPEGQYILLEPSGVHPNEAFQVKVSIGWRSILLEFLLGKFAADLVYQMGTSTDDKKQVFVSVAQEIIKEKGVLNFKVNDTPYNPLEADYWPKTWKTFSLSLRRSPLEINTEDHALTENLTNLWVERFFGCVIALSPLEETQEDQELSGLPEGAVTRVPVNRYERSRYNRTLCINFHGADCKVCGVNFGKLYGPIGAGFIHVHHIVPVSRLGAGYVINPIRDLVPVCPNCHAMVHKNDPPFSIDELKAMITSSMSLHSRG